MSVTIQCKSKVESGAKWEARRNVSQKDQKSFSFFRFRLRCRRFRSGAEQGERNRKWKRNYQPIKKLITGPFQEQIPKVFPDKVRATGFRSSIGIEDIKVVLSALVSVVAGCLMND